MQQPVHWNPGCMGVFRLWYGKPEVLRRHREEALTLRWTLGRSSGKLWSSRVQRQLERTHGSAADRYSVRSAITGSTRVARRAGM